MPFARSLPAALAPRFDRAERRQGTTEAGSFELVVARKPVLRLRGLAGLERRELVPLLFPRCRSVHTFWMRTPIDVVWLEFTEEEAVVLDVAESLAPRRLARAPGGTPRRSTAALELPPGDALSLGLATGSTMAVGS